MRILFASSEIAPLAKTGGLGDVSASLPLALASHGQEIWVVIPGYPAALAGLYHRENLGPIAGLAGTALVRGLLPGTQLRVLVVDIPALFDRPNGPYADVSGRDWPDNAVRFHGFARAVCAIALDRCGLNWRPDIVHCNDWQTGLIPALLSRQPQRPGSVFTIHNQAYQGLFDRSQFHALGLPADWWAMEALEFYGQFSFLKSGLVFANQLTTVSPTYARQLLEPAFGCGLDGLLRHRRANLTGILNGIDEHVWNPATDAHLPSRYGVTAITEGKRSNKLALQMELALTVDGAIPILCVIGRLVEQKGIDLIIALIAAWAHRPLQWVILGNGEARWERRLQSLAAAHPDRIAVRVGYDEALAHRMLAGADLFLMPSRFEPCGLTQMYSQRYGTPPVVHRTGGLADTVVDASPANLPTRHGQPRPTGVVFEQPTTAALASAVDRALQIYHQPLTWRDLQRNGMNSDFGWRQSAERYLAVYHRALLPASRVFYG